ncbi:hypothetical protein B9Z65_4579 [Elsinoe australis]|uniref:CRIB domain-containing protein n=1 Tax=Elsinoe australis TaxID=40998 RepID=A0A2P8A5G1_9PEZI|nr:hypothetical protein B9Z65_4579 [Elsinoe australis]
MAPNWLQFSHESGKRASVLSAVSSSRKTTYDDPEAFNHPFFDSTSIHDTQDPSERESTVDRAPSKKRYSLFARSIATISDGDSDRPSPESSRHWPRLPFQDKQSDLAEDDEESSNVSRKPSRKSIAPRNGRHEPILRWMRRVERSSSTRPSTPFGFGERASSREEDVREQKKASISSPFNFQHVTHTQPRELPQLDLVSDRDLTLTFWASSAHQQPQNDLRGIKAEDIDDAQRMSRPGSAMVESRPNSSSESVNFSRIRSSSIGRDAAPRLRTSRSLSNASERSNEESRRPSMISRSASLASLIAEPRSPPTMVHPAFRDATPLPQHVMPWMQPSGMQTPPNELNRNLDVVPEEIESQSPRKSSTFDKMERAAIAGQRRFEENAASEQAHRSFSSIGSDGQDTSTIDMSVPSLSSGETWEDDIDFCYNMEAESTCDFTYGQGQNPHDSVLAPPRKVLADMDNHFDVSPRVSIAAHQRNRSSMTMTPFLASSSKLDLLNAFENPRNAPGAPLPEINRLSSLFDLPMFKSETEAISPGKSSDDTVTDLRSSQILQSTEKQSHYQLASRHARSGSLDNSSVRSATPDANRLSYMAASPRTSIIKASEPVSRPTSVAQAPSPPPSVPLPPIPSDTKKTKSFIAAKRATVAAASEEIIMRRPQTAEDRSLLQAAGRNVQHTRTATPPRLQVSRSVETPSLRDLMQRSKSSPSVNDLYKAHAIPKTAEKFPVWI